MTWAEEHGAEEVSREGMQSTLNENALMTDDMDPFVLSHHVWGFLLHCLTGAAKQVFKSVAREDGLNVWRKLTLDINSRTDCIRHALRNQCQQVSQVGNNTQVWQAIADWETLYTKYREAGGSEMEFEDRRGQMLRILPKDLRRDAFRRLGEFRDVSAFKEWIREQFEYEKEWGVVDKSNTIHAKALETQLYGGAEREPEDNGDLEAFMVSWRITMRTSCLLCNNSSRSSCIIGEERELPKELPKEDRQMHSRAQR